MVSEIVLNYFTSLAGSGCTCERSALHFPFMYTAVQTVHRLAGWATPAPLAAWSESGPLSKVLFAQAWDNIATAVLPAWTATPVWWTT